MNPQQLSHELRQEESPDLTRRRWIIGLSLFGIAMAKAVSLYQTGIIKHLPDPPISLFNSSKVDASTYAYKRMDTPDGLLMLVTYATTAVLAGTGGKARAQMQPWLPLAMGAKLVYDTINVVKLTQEEWEENRALCFYCQLASVASVASLVLAAPEVMRSIQSLTNSRQSIQLRDTQNRNPHVSPPLVSNPQVSNPQVSNSQVSNGQPINLQSQFLPSTQQDAKIALNPS